MEMALKTKKTKTKTIAFKKMWHQLRSVTRQETRSNPFQSTSDLQADAHEEQKQKKSLQRRYNQGYIGRQI